MKTIFFVSLFIAGIFFYETSVTWWETASIWLFSFFLLQFLYRVGIKIVVLDLIIISAILSWLIMPVVFYHFYTIENPLAKIWLRYMPISSDDYFSFAVPSTVCMIVGLRFPLANLKLNKQPALYIQNVKRILFSRSKTGIILIWIGLISSLLNFMAPAGLKQVFYLMAHLTFVGFFYVLYSPNKYKKVILTFIILLLIGQALAQGMFGEMIYMSALMFPLTIFGRKISYQRKLFITILGFFVIFMIQSVKGDYRKRSWLEGAGSDPLYFAQLIADRITNPSSLFDADQFFFTGVRFNQGWLVAKTMQYVPNKYPYGNGETIWQSVLASFVPRFLWPDKPEAGGKDNLKRFWGYDLVGYSMNIGPSGEAYANFGITGGCVYMFFYGLFFNLLLVIVLKQAEKRPTVILWLPFLFVYAISVETDLLTTMNALMKASFFTFIMFKLFKSIFKEEL
jgi:hypothetical protein